MDVEAEIVGEEVPAVDVADTAIRENGQEEPDGDRFTYYVIEDLSARVGSNPEKGEVERF